MKCILCERRKAKRYCPAKKTSICPVCCGEKRGVEIDCPLDCRYYVEGQKYQQKKIAKKRLQKEGAGSFVRRAELYQKNPGLFVDIERSFVDVFRENGDMNDRDLYSGFELSLKTLETQGSGLLYEHKSENRIANEAAKSVLDVIREYKDAARVGQGRISLHHAKSVLVEYMNEIEFFMDKDTNPRSYLIHISRYHPEDPGKTQSGGGLIIQP